ncbi:MAG: GNAT family N-acetyltransferase [Chloroflexi bacterium]|nr:GNAT family N-acetyltransferase [Chloroflexota bacterium]
MHVIPLTPEQYENWDAFCSSCPEAWFWHTSHYLQYQLHYRRDYRPIPLSFAVADENGEWLAAVPLLLEHHPAADGTEWKELSTGIGSRDFPLMKGVLGRRQEKKVAKFIAGAVDELARQHRVARVAFRCNPLTLAGPDSPASLALLEAGFQFVARHSQVLDLNETRERLWADIRKSYQSLINASIKKGMKVHFLTGDGCSMKDIVEYRLLHAKDAGRVTRPDETFDLQLQWARAGRAVLARASLSDGHTAGFAYILCFNHKAYYMSACTDPDVEDEHRIGHSIQWKVIEWLCHEGFDSYETGDQHLAPNLYYDVTPKDVSISLFKRGLGGRTVLVPWYERYYDSDLLRGTVLERVDKLVAYIQGSAS